jgi:glutamate dehydrogenase (NADP+)
LRLNWTSEEVDGKLKVLCAIHASCVKYGSDTNGYVDYVKVQISPVVKVADAMLAQGV